LFIVKRNQQEKRENIRHIVIVLILLASIGIPYGQVGDYEFVNYDDPRYVTTFADERLTPRFVMTLMTSFGASNWHPLTWLSHIVDTRLFGMNAGAHHLVNVLFHLINTLLLYFILYKATGEAWKSCLVAGLFAIHPLHVESVAWIAERKDVLSTLFWMLSIIAYMRYARRARWTTYLPVIFFFMLGLMTKPMVVTLPFVLLLLDVWPLGRIGLFRHGGPDGVPARHLAAGLVIEKIPLLGLSGAVSLLTILAQKSGGAVNSLDYFPLGFRLANALVSYATYLGKTFIPVNMAVFYPYPAVIPMWKILFSGIVLIAISFAVVKQSRNHPYLLVGWLWFIGTLVPVIGLVQAGTQSMADRYTYIPLIGLFVMAAWGFPAILENFRHRKITVLTVGLLVYSLFLLLTWQQVRCWADNFSLYTHAIAVTDRNHVAHNNLGAALYKKGEVYKSIWHFRSAFEIKPDYYEALVNFRAAILTGQTVDQALENVKRLLSLYPENSGLYYTKGVLYGQKGDLGKAIDNYQEALWLYPEFAQAYFDQGYFYALSGDHANALAAYGRAVKIQPDLVWAYYHAAAILSLENRLEASAEQLRKAIEKGFNDWVYLQNDLKMDNLKKSSLYQRVGVNNIMK